MKMKKKFRGVYDEKGERRSKQEEAEVARRPAVVMRHGRLSYNVAWQPFRCTVSYYMRDGTLSSFVQRDGHPAVLFGFKAIATSPRGICDGGSNRSPASRRVSIGLCRIGSGDSLGGGFSL